MRKVKAIFVAALVVLGILGGVNQQARGQDANTAYPAMAPVDQYMIADQSAEIALARSAAPASIADHADVMVLGPHGYTTAVKGTNGFMCLVERSWANVTDNGEFWNPTMRAPNCFNAAATTTLEQIYMMKTKLVLAGKSRAEIHTLISAALDKGELPALAPGAMCYMMSKQQYLNDHDKSWHPHVMVFVAGNAAESWGANLLGSPVIAGTDPEERVTIMMILANHWSDGSPGPSMEH